MRHVLPRASPDIRWRVVPAFAYETAHGFFPAFHGRRARRGEKQTGHETANNRAVKSFIVGQISQDRISATSGHRELHRAFAQTFLQFVEIEIEPATRIADDDDRFGLHAPPRHGPKILVVIQGGSVTNRAAIEFPGRRRGDNDQHDNNSDAAPRNLRDRALELERWTAMTLSASVGWRKNKRGSRSMRLKLEVDEGIAVSLSENDGARHQGPGRGHNPARQTRHRGFDVGLAQRPVREHHEEGDDADLQHFARGQNRVAMRVPAEHSAQHSRGDGEIRGAEKNPRDTDCAIGNETEQKFDREIVGPRLFSEEGARGMLDHEIEAMK